MLPMTAPESPTLACQTNPPGPKIGLTVARKDRTASASDLKAQDIASDIRGVPRRLAYLPIDGRVLDRPRLILPDGGTLSTPHRVILLCDGYCQSRPR